VINPRDWLGNTPLHKAATGGHFAICEMIIDNLTNKNPEDFNGITPLHWAAHYGHLSICQLIMRNCDEKNPKGHMGDTPFYFAARMGQVKICKFFIENLSIDDITIQNSFDETPLDIAERMIQHIKSSTLVNRPRILIKYFLSFPQKTCRQRKLRQTKCLLFNF
jgi:ankyrin repeat protein